MRTMAALLVAMGMGWAQETPPAEAPGQETPRAEPSRQDRATGFWTNMLRDRLQLSEDQTARIREIISKDAEERAKKDEERGAKIREVLNDEQKRMFDDLQRNPFGGGRGLQGAGRGQGPAPGPGQAPGQGFRGFGQGGGMQGRFGQVQVEDLQRELELTEEQVGKLRPIVEEFNTKGQRRWEELRENGFRGFNWQEELKRVEDLVKEAGDQVKPHLTEEQKGKYDQLVESRMSWLRLAQGFMGNRGGTPTPRASRRGNPEERAGRVVEALKIQDEKDRQAIAALVAEVFKLQAELDDMARAARERLEGMSKNAELSDSALEDAMKEIRLERRQKERELAGLQKELSESVSNRQELELLIQGVLR